MKLLAQAKATAVAQTLDPVGDAEITAVLGCDSVLSFEGQVFGSPQGQPKRSSVGSGWLAAADLC